MKKTTFHLRLALLLGTTLIPAQAEPYTWDSNPVALGVNAGGGVWNTSNSNWKFLVILNGPWSNSTDNNAIFGGTGVGGAVNIEGGVTANGLTFNVAGYSITGATLTLGGSTPTITTNSDATIEAIIAGNTSSDGITKTGAETLTLSGSNIYTGATIINSGTLKANVTSVANTSGAFGKGSAVTLGNIAGATMDLANFSTEIGSLAGGGTAGGNVTLGSATLTTGRDNTSTSYAGSISGSGGLTKIGTGTQTLSEANSYSGTTTVSAGTLLANNTSGSATGSGAVSVAGTLGGSGKIKPEGTNGINVTGVLAPGASVGTIGNLTIDLGSTTGTVAMASGSKFELQLGISGADINASSTNDVITLANASLGDFAFNGSTIDFKNSGVNGFYKLFDTSSDSATTWTGLTVNSTTGLITEGLSVTGLTGGKTGSLIMGDTSLGRGATGDIYLHVIPEPSAALLAGIGSLVLLRRRRAA